MKNPTKTLQKIKEIIDTGTLSSVSGLETDQHIQALKNLTKIYAIGPKNATKLYKEKNIFTVSQLKDAISQDSSILNNKQKIGLKYYEPLTKRIPIDEIEKFNEKFASIFKEVAPEGSKYDVVGSYRRGAKNSGDIDIIITNNQNNIDAFNKFLDKLIS